MRRVAQCVRPARRMGGPRAARRRRSELQDAGRKARIAQRARLLPPTAEITAGGTIAGRGPSAARSTGALRCGARARNERGAHNGRSSLQPLRPRGRDVVTRTPRAVPALRCKQLRARCPVLSPRLVDAPRPRRRHENEPTTRGAPPTPPPGPPPPRQCATHLASADLPSVAQATAGCAGAVKAVPPLRAAMPWPAAAPDQPPPSAIPSRAAAAGVSRGAAASPPAPACVLDGRASGPPPPVLVRLVLAAQR